MERKYWVLAWDTHYPGSWLDNVKGRYHSQEEADAKVRSLQDKSLELWVQYEHAYVVNIEEYFED